MNTPFVKILALDDDETFLDSLKDALSGYGQVDTYSTIDQGLAAVEANFYDIAILDLNFENDDRDGLNVFRRIMALDRGVEVVMCTGETDLKRIFELSVAGVKHYLQKPPKVDDLHKMISMIIEEREYRKRTLALEEAQFSDVRLIGSSPKMNQLREQIDRVVRSGVRDILLLGETGTGKEVITKYIVSRSDPNGRCIPVNCGALQESILQSELFGHVRGAFTGADRDKEGVFEAARGGFVFLDEIGEMPMSQQPALLRALEERKINRVGDPNPKAVNFRTISATHVDLTEAVSQQKFRQDLYYRVSREVINIPALRERMEDLGELAQFFLNRFKKGSQLTSDALALLSSYSWPGNIRELSHVMERAINRADGNLIKSSHIIQALPALEALSPRKIRNSVIGTYGMQLIAAERKRFTDAILQARGDRSKAAAILGLPRTTYFRKAKELGLVKNRKTIPGS